MDRNRWLIFAGICVAVIAGLVFASNNDRLNVDDVDAFAITTTREINDHVYGNKNANIVIYEYGDFQCPGCGGAHPNLKAIKEKYKDSVAVVYRHFPLTTIHPHAFAAAATAEAAGLQGKFWEMHDLLFETQDVWKDQTAEQRQRTFEGYAGQLGLNIEQYKTDLGSEKVTAKIEFDRAVGRKVNVDSTPTVFVNKEKLAEDVATDLIQAQGEKLNTQLDALIKPTAGQ